MVGGGPRFCFPPPLPFVSIVKSLASFNGCLNPALLIIEFSFRTYGDGIELGFKLGGLWNDRFLLFNAERVGALRPPLFHLGGLGLANGGREFG